MSNSFCGDDRQIEVGVRLLNIAVQRVLQSRVPNVLFSSFNR
jgi:hypothetical protein